MDQEKMDQEVSTVSSTVSSTSIETFTFTINKVKITIPKSIVSGIPFFDAKLLRWNEKEDFNIEPLDTDDKSIEMLLKTIFSFMTPIEIENYEVCCGYIKYADFFTSNALMTKCLTYLKKIIDRNNIIDIYLNNSIYISDINFLSVCKQQIGKNIMNTYKKLIECDLDLLAELSSHELCYFETQFGKYTFVKTLCKEMSIELDDSICKLEIPNVRLRIDKKMCIRIWLASINFIQFTPEEFNKLIQEGFLPNTIMHQNLDLLKNMWKIIESKNIVKIPIYIYQSITIIKAGNDPYSIKDFLNIKRFPVVKFAGVNFSLEIRETSKNPRRMGFFLFREDTEEHRHYYEEFFNVSFAIRVGSNIIYTSSDGAFVQRAFGWGWKDLLSYEELFNCGDYIDENEREVRIFITIKEFNGVKPK